MTNPKEFFKYLVKNKTQNSKKFLEYLANYSDDKFKINIKEINELKGNGSYIDYYLTIAHNKYIPENIRNTATDILLEAAKPILKKRGNDLYKEIK